MKTFINVWESLDCLKIGNVGRIKFEKKINKKVNKLLVFY